MQELGFNSYQDVIERGIVEACAQCPHPGKNLKDGWEKEPNA